MLQKIVVFKLNEQEYGVNVSDIQSIEHITTFTPVPQVERYFKGIIHLRGDIIPVIDLKLKLNMGVTDITNTTKIIVTKTNNLFIGFLVDEATNVLDFNVKKLEDPTELTREKGYIVKGIIKHTEGLILLIQFTNVLEDKDILIVQELSRKKQ